jgi:hypothetical protein
MPHAIIFGIDLGQGTVSQVLTHERRVRSTFEAFKAEGWTSAIVMVTDRQDIANEPDVEAILTGVDIQSGTQVGNAIRDYAIENCDLAVFSYIVNGWTRNSLGTLPESGIPLFMPIRNESGGNQNGYHSNIVLCGAGDTENIALEGEQIWFYDVATNLTGDQRLYTSYTTAVIAGKATHYMATLDGNQARKAMVYAGSRYPTWTQQNGWGRLPDVAVISDTFLLEPVNKVLAQTSTFSSVKNCLLQFTPFRGGQSEVVRIYANDELVYEGLGDSAQGYNLPGLFATPDVRMIAFPESSFSGEVLFELVAYDENTDTESRVESFSTASYTFPIIPDPEPEPDPEPDPEPEPEPDPEPEPEPDPEPEPEPDPEPEPPPPDPEPEPEPETPPYNPNPNLFLSRSGTTNTLSTDGGGATQTFQRRNNIEAEWQTVTTTDTQPANETFMYRVKVSDGVTESAWSDTVYSIATQVSTQKLIIL